MESPLAGVIEIKENNHYSVLVAVLVWADVLYFLALNTHHTNAKMPDFVLLPFQDNLWSTLSRPKCCSHTEPATDQVKNIWKRRLASKSP